MPFQTQTNNPTYGILGLGIMVATGAGVSAVVFGWRGAAGYLLGVIAIIVAAAMIGDGGYDP